MVVAIAVVVMHVMKTSLVAAAFEVTVAVTKTTMTKAMTLTMTTMRAIMESDSSALRRQRCHCPIVETHAGAALEIMLLVP
jgi:hypothetical protein